MKPRERLITALKREEPDRVPIDLGGSTVTGIHVLAYRELKKLLGLESGNIRARDYRQLLAEPEKEVIEHLGVDVIDIERTLPPSLDSIQGGGTWKKWFWKERGVEVELCDSVEVEDAGDHYILREKVSYTRPRFTYATVSYTHLTLPTN